MLVSWLFRVPATHPRINSGRLILRRKRSFDLLCSASLSVFRTDNFSDDLRTTSSDFLKNAQKSTHGSYAMDILGYSKINILDSGPDQWQSLCNRRRLFLQKKLNYRLQLERETRSDERVCVSKKKRRCYSFVRRSITCLVRRIFRQTMRERERKIV